MSAESSLHFRRARIQHAGALISLAVLFAVLALLVFVALLGLINPGLSPASEPELMGPFRWASHPPIA